MMNLFKKIKKNILIYDLLFASANIIINFILYLMNMRFRLWFIILIIFVSIVGFIIGIFQQIYLSSDENEPLGQQKTYLQKYLQNKGFTDFGKSFF